MGEGKSSEVAALDAVFGGAEAVAPAVRAAASGRAVLRAARVVARGRGVALDVGVPLAEVADPLACSRDLRHLLPEVGFQRRLVDEAGAEVLLRLASPIEPVLR